MNWINLFIKRHVLALVLSTMVILFGTVAYQRIGVDRYPSIEQPTLNVTTTLTGATPDVIDQSITQPIESAVNRVAGIDLIESTSSTGTSRVQLTFNLDKDIDVAFNEVQSALERVRRRLPDDADAPIVSKSDPNSAPIMMMSLNGTHTERELYKYANNIISKQLEVIDGVGSIAVFGRGQRVIRVSVDSLKLAGYGLGIQDVSTALRKEHRQEAGGTLVSGSREYVIDLDQEYHSVEALKSVVITAKNGLPIMLRDVATVIDGEGDIRSINRTNGQPGVSIAVIRVPNTNTVSTADKIIERIEQQIRPSLPEGMHLDIANNSASYINEMVEALKAHLVEGTLLAALVVWLFLRNWRATLIVSTAIPVSLLGAIALMYFLGYTFNTITLLGLLLLIGVVVDDAIVVLEAIHRREEEGDEPMVAAEKGTQEVVFAVVAATLSLVAIFLPIVFLTSTVGRLFNAFAVVVAFGVMVSLFVSLTLTPMLCSRFLKSKRKPGKVYQKLEQMFIVLERTYTRSLLWVLSHRQKVLYGCLALVAVGFGTLFLLKTEFYPTEDESRFDVRLRTPIGSSVFYTDNRAREVEARLKTMPEIDTVLVQVGRGGGNNANISIRLKPKNQRKASQAELMDQTRKLLNDIPGTKLIISAPPRLGESRGGSLRFSVVGSDKDTAQTIGMKLAENLEATDLFGRIDSDTENEQPQLKVQVKREQAAQLGLTTQDVLAAVNELTAGKDVGQFSDGDGERYDIRVKSSTSAMNKPQDLAESYIRSGTGQMIPLSSVADIEPTLNASQIERSSLQYAISFSASPTIALGDAMTMVTDASRQLLPPGYWVEFKGQARELSRSGGELMFVFGLASLMLYLVLAAQFNSFLQPALIMLAEPLAVVGGLVALWLFGLSLNIYSVIGLVLLIGLVAKNAILLVDITNQYRSQLNMGIDEALAKSCPIRLRPVLMTSLTVVLAMFPAALGLGAGAETNGPLAVAVIGGMISSTFLTLLVIPAAYSLLAHWQERREQKALAKH
ncbi:MAG: efflux RND transporter permease subunit [Neisseriaceae bacterium]|nr:efflux RND transporter permease subunit [Neisseriaceae bacterium]MBP6863447.1 efflux RND transporter permease subunit [Neisseriaceae bacterium]